MRLEWSVNAVNDRIAIFDYIEQDSPQAACLVDDRIEAHAETLGDFPEIGRAGRVEGTRELVIQRTPYILCYLIAEQTVRILRVLHGARLWPEDIASEPE